MWYYESPIGTIYIKRTAEGYGIFFDDICYGNYQSPVAAADDVYTQSTGCDEWDMSNVPIEQIPTDLYEWEQTN